MSACLDCGCHGGDHFTHCPRRGQRLAVNINADCAETLRRVTAKHDITVTEAIRRAISLLDWAERSDKPIRFVSRYCENCRQTHVRQVSPDPAPWPDCMRETGGAA